MITRQIEIECTAQEFKMAQSLSPRERAQLLAVGRKVTGFNTLVIREKHGKYYVYSLCEGATVASPFNSIEDADNYAKEEFVGEYI
jgi:hypothetical protein